MLRALSTALHLVLDCSCSAACCISHACALRDNPHRWGQCGGSSGCSSGAHAPCGNGAWQDVRCPGGSTCTPVTPPYYWQCLPNSGGSTPPPQESGGTPQTPPSTNPAPPSGPMQQPLPYGQCGGKSNCPANLVKPETCADMKWWGVECPLRFECTRSDAWFWGCRPISDGGAATPPSYMPVGQM